MSAEFLQSLPPDVLASLQPVGGTSEPENAAQRVTLDADALHEIAVSNYRASVAYFGDAAPWNEVSYRGRLTARIQRHVFERGWLESGGDWSFRRKNLAAYADYERNFEQAGRVA